MYSIPPQESYPDYPELLRVAVSLGRRSQEPLQEFTALFASPDNEYLSLHLHPLQSCLPKDQLKRALEIEIVNRVNDIGVDVNFAMEHPHTAPMLQYVCGLGPRKAPALIKVCVYQGMCVCGRLCVCGGVCVGVCVCVCACLLCGWCLQYFVVLCGSYVTCFRLVRKLRHHSSFCVCVYDEVMLCELSCCQRQ